MKSSTSTVLWWLLSGASAGACWACKLRVSAIYNNCPVKAHGIGLTARKRASGMDENISGHVQSVQ